MNLPMTDASNVPWYRQGWPWFLIALPATAVAAGIATLWFAVQDWDGLVSDDYYKEGLAVVKTVGRLERAREMGLSARAWVRDGAVSVDLSAALEVDLPPELHLAIIHPAHSRFDQRVVLHRGEDGLYSGKIAPLGVGRWRFQLEDKLKDERELRNENESRSWRMDGIANLPTETEVFIGPSDS
ncbi:MAG: FixH family protein [Azoarcus sp.]|jgi:hypothetical protein|nr:FixH family protein [Azoarcus sp.]